MFFKKLLESVIFKIETQFLGQLKQEDIIRLHTMLTQFFFTCSRSYFAFFVRF